VTTPPGVEERAGDTTPEIWGLRLRDRPGALERVLSVLRRRLVPLEALSLRKTPEGALDVELVVAGDAGRWDRVRTELRNLFDVMDEGTRTDGARKRDHLHEAEEADDGP
jgi:acetolactate synthase regulatory subunit